MARGRKHFHDTPREWKIYLPSSLCDEISEALKDPLTGKIAYGARNKLLTRLLREWVQKREKIRAEFDDLSLDELNKPC